MKILLNEEKKKAEDSFCLCFRTLLIFWDQKLNLAISRGEGPEGLCMVFSWKYPKLGFYGTCYSKGISRMIALCRHPSTSPE